MLHELSDRLAEPWRVYHGADHVRASLAEFDRVEYQARLPNALQWAIWFHDAIYDPRRHDNEERSAEWACRVAAEAGLPKDFQDGVKSMILATKHDAPPANHDDELMVDIDLAILGQPAAKFDGYDAAIRQEYAHVPEAEYRAGRAKVLKSFLTRPHIYFTAPFRGRYEGMARANLERARASRSTRRAAARTAAASRCGSRVAALGIDHPRHPSFLIISFVFSYASVTHSTMRCGCGLYSSSMLTVLLKPVARIASR